MTTEGVYKMLVSYRTGDMWAPRLEMNEALQSEIAHSHGHGREARLGIAGSASKEPLALATRRQSAVPT